MSLQKDYRSIVEDFEEDFDLAREYAFAADEVKIKKRPWWTYIFVVGGDEDEWDRKWDESVAEWRRRSDLSDHYLGRCKGHIDSLYELLVLNFDQRVIDGIWGVTDKHLKRIVNSDESLHGKIYTLKRIIKRTTSNVDRLLERSH